MTTTAMEPLMTRADVAKLFQVTRVTTYHIKGLDSCRVKVPGLKRPRFDPVKVRALFNKRQHG